MVREDGPTTVNYRDDYFNRERRSFLIGIGCLSGSLFVKICSPAAGSLVFGLLENVLLAAAVILFLFVLLSPVRVPCSNCAGSVASNAVWVCGNCKNTNRWPRLHSFLHSCGTCKASPKVFFCPYCSTALFLDKDEAQKPYGFLAGKPDPAQLAVAHEAAAVAAIKSARDKYREKRALKSEERKDRIDELTDVKEVINKSKEVLEADIGFRRTEKKWKAEVEGRDERKEDMVETYRKLVEEEGVEEYDAARIVEAECDKRFANDPEMRERVRAVIKKRLERGTL